MAEFDYEVVNGRKIRVRPVETVSEVDENGYFHRQPNHFTKGFGPGENPIEKGRYGLGKAVPLVKPCIHREGASGAGGCHQYQYGRTCAS